MTLRSLPILLILALASTACTGRSNDGTGDDTAPPDTGETDLEGADEDGDGRIAASDGGPDCDDRDSTVFPGAPEIVADGIDQDCDGVDLCFEDGDGDGFGSPRTVPGDPDCQAPGRSTSPEDCRDDDATISPDAIEICDEVDQDCNGVIDDVSAPPTHWLDRDDDGFGDPDAAFSSCRRPPGYVRAAADPPDCDDLDPRSRPGALEIPGDGTDQNCDGVDACWPDADGDGHGAIGSTPRPGSSLGCTGFGDAPDDEDCNDSDASIRPGAPERCGTVDRDCDGVIGDEDPDVPEDQRVQAWADEDGDGQGDPFTPIADCVPDTDTTADNALDCNDDLATVFTGAIERCNGIDDDCDRKVDDDDSDTVGQEAFYADRDRDGFGDPDDRSVRCYPEAPWIRSNGLDCDDTTELRSPTRTEVAGNVLDEDCDLRLRCFVDADGDGAAGSETAELDVAVYDDCEADGYGRTFADCDDSDSDVQLITFYADVDEDGWGVESNAILSCTPPNRYTDRPGDCNDFTDQVRPDAPEIPGNLRDDDCDGREVCFRDADNDGRGGTDTDASTDLLCNADGESYVSTDCNDSDDTVFPGAPEIIGDGLDQDCDDRDSCFLDADGDGAGVPVVQVSDDLLCDGPRVAPRPDDCNDSDDSIFPGAIESCNGRDDDCDDRIDDDDPDVAEGRTPFWRDGDGDGLGDPDDVVQACLAPSSDRVDNADDCDDTRPRWGVLCPWEDVVAGDGFTCGLRTDGSVDCVGGTPAGITPTLSGTFVQLSAADGLVCGVDTDGLRWCSGDVDDPRTPPLDGEPADAVVVASGGVCTVLDSSITCTDSLSSVVLSSAGPGWDRVAAGSTRACGLDADGLECSDTTCPDLPDPTDAVDLVADDTVACVRTDAGRLRCDGCAGPRRDDAPDDPRIAVQDVAIAASGACASTWSGVVTCWDADPALQTPPVVDGPSDLAIGTAHACVIDDDRVIWCWGDEAASRTPQSPAAPSP